jgi:polar amino acid transport system substrate-binding protein
MRFAYSLNYPPISFSQEGKAAGLKIDIVNYIFQQRLALPVQHDLIPWNRAQTHMENGQYDGMLSICTPERLRFSEASQYPLYTTTVHIYVRKDDHRMDHVDQLQELKPFKIGAQLGNSWAKNKLAGMQAEFISDPSALPRMLLAKRFDAVILDNLAMAYILGAQRSNQDIRELTMPLDKAEVHVLLSKLSPFLPLLPFVDTEVKRMKHNSSIEQLINDYKNLLNNLGAQNSTQHSLRTTFFKK